MKDENLVHEQHTAILMSLSAIAVMADGPYRFWQTCGLMREQHKDIAQESRVRCEAAMLGLCKKLDEAMQLIGDAVNGMDGADEHGLTNAAFEQMRRALGETVEGDG